MKHKIKHLALGFALAAMVAGCRTTEPSSTHNQPENELANSIYHWKTTFAPNGMERDFLRQHDIKRLYIRMFDVATERNLELDRIEVVPIATTKFASAPPKDIEIIPTTYITLDALRKMQGEEEHYAELIVERLRAMASYNECGKIREVQFDCDWTHSTANSYFALCSAARNILRADTIALSTTIRLHQLGDAVPPVDRGVLMLYNTGNIKDDDTKNSILDINDIKPYVKKMKYPIPLDYIYPTFGWGVKFRYEADCSEATFVSIVSKPECDSLQPLEFIRVERPTAQEVLNVKRHIEDMLGKPDTENIIYHLDLEQLKHYTHDEIDEIYSNN